jgi:hypothetical protein
MKQGSASRDGAYSQKREPIVHEVSPGAVSQIGSAMGNHATGNGQRLSGSSLSLYQGRGFEAPHDAGRDIHHGGSQGRR